MPRVRNATSKSVLLLFIVLIALIFTAMAALSARAATVAGVTPGALAVDERGQASYEIPLSVPPGIAGMAPSLSLIYSSGAGNGIAGLGWSLGGLSAIHRCARNLAQDGAVGGINFDGNDRFCLDGKRLVAIAGAYGAEGTEYRTEIDGLFKVISYGTAGSGPAWWRVWTKSGQIMDYGATADSRIEAAGRAEAKVWAANKIADTAGNYLTQTYFENTATGAHHIERIDYAANDAAGVTAQSAVTFLYEARPDVIKGYTAGSLGTMDQRLKTVQTLTGNALVRDYRIAYEIGAATGRSRLVSVTECDGAGSCLAPTTFTWSDGDTGFASPASWIASYGTGTGGWISDDLYPRWLADVNGDGLPDIVGFASTGVYVSLSTGNGFESPAKWIAAYGPSAGGWSSNSTYPRVMADVNGDGLDDILGFASTGVFVSLSTGSSFEASARWVDNFGPSAGGWTDDNIWPRRLADVNGDGLPDIVGFGSQAVVVSLSTGSSFEAPTTWNTNYGSGTGGWSDENRWPRRLADVNGDGLPDIVGFGSQAVVVSLSTGSSFEAPATWSTSYGTGSGGWSSNSTYPRVMADVNGDGLDDILGFASTGVFVSLSTGSSFEASARWVDNFGTSAGGWTDDNIWPRRLADVNGDGLPDIVGFGSQAVVVSLSTGSSFEAPTTWNTNYGSGTGGWSDENRWPRRLADVNGDGLPDIVGFGSQAVVVSPREGEPADRLTIITHSLGAQTDIDYSPLTDPSVYEKGSDAVFPVQDIQSPLTVVSAVSSDNGIGGQAVTRYSYAGAKVHAQGRGFLGFRFMDAIDEQSGIHTTTRHAQDFPFTGQVEFTESYLANGTTLSQTVNTLSSLSLHGGSTHLPYVSQSVAESYELNHGPNNLPVTTATTDSVYDDFGNPTQITVTTAGGGESFVTATVNSYANDTAKWHLGRLTRAEVTKTLPDLSSATRVSAFAYDPATGLLAQEVVEPDLPALKLTTDHSRDAFGNVTATTVSGADIAARTSTTTYSADGRFPEISANALGHSSTTVFDPGLGLAVSQTGSNGVTTTWDYDGFGRKTREDRADGTATLWDYELCVAQCPAGAVYLVRQKNVIAATGAVTGAIATAYHDALNRVFRKETEGFDGTPILADSIFNERGELAQVSRPYFAGTPYAEIQWATTLTDAIGRTLSVTAPDGGMETSFHDGLTTAMTNALGQSRIKIKNALGQLTWVMDSQGALGHRYDPFGNLVETNAGGAITTLSHDVRGRKTAMDDPDMGAWSYAYNVLGELVSQTDAKLQTVTMTYDKLGRMVSRTEAEGITTWTYDNPLKVAGIGKLDRVSRSQDDYVEEPSYDSLGRPSEALVSYEGATYSTTTSYDEAGRVATLTYPSGFAVENVYNAFGRLEEVRELGGAGTVYWRAVDVNAEGQVIEEQLGNGLTTQRDFDPATGLVRSIGTFNGLTPLQDLTYQFDKLGNLTSRADGLQSREENFTYDGVNRLTGATVTDTVLLTQLGQTTYGYDALGNITYKSDVGAYSYNGMDGGPHAVTSAGGKSYAYDANGAMTSTALAGGALTRSVGWSSFNKPVHIQAHDRLATSDFVYGPGRNRIKQTTVKAPVISTVTYIGKHYEKHARGGTPDKLKHYIRAGGTVAIYTKVDDANPASDKTRYLHRDHLGSIDLVTDEAGLVAERLAYDAHGKRRTADWQAASVNLLGQETARGFTGHEHLDSVGLVHMNGRVYDPEIGRFLSADPVVQHPDNLQSYNRYSYVNNNPLSFTDPSGFFLKKLFKAIGKAFRAIGRFFKSILQSKIGQIVGSIIASSFGPIGTAAFSALVTVANGGSLTDALMAGAVSFAAAWAGGKIGSHFDARPQTLGNLTARSVAHGAVGGVSSKLRGGRFGTGFLSSAFAQLATPALARVPDNLLAKTITEAMAGGVAAKLGGGKFADGARTSAFMHALGEFVDYTTRETDRLKRLSCSVGNGVCEEDERGVLKTAGVRNDENHRGAGSLLWSMQEEAKGQHWFDDPKYGFIGRIARYFVTDVSKIHDWMNAIVSYDYDTGLYKGQGGVALNTAFDAFYSLPGMPIAAALTFVGYGSRATFAQQAEAYNIYGGRP